MKNSKLPPATTRSRNQKTNKRAFTLIEVFICLGLIMLCGSVFAIKGRQLWQRHQFQNSVDELISELKLVRNLSQTLRADITCELVPDQGGVHFYRRSDEPYLKKMERQVKPRIFLKRLHIAEPVTIQFSNQYWESSTSSIFITGEEKVMVYVNEERFATKHYVK